VVLGGWVYWCDDRVEYCEGDVGYQTVMDAGVRLRGQNGESGQREPIL